MTAAEDFATAQQMSDVLLAIETGEVEFPEGVKQLHARIAQLNSVPDSWKTKLIELCAEMEAHIDDEQVIGGVMERVENAILHIQKRA